MSVGSRVVRHKRPVVNVNQDMRSCATLSAAILDLVLSDEDLDAIEARCAAASPGPWTSFVEDRDHSAGDDFIRISDSDDEPDMYVSRAEAGSIRPASPSDLDFIAAARQDIPALVAEIRRLRDATD